MISEKDLESEADDDRVAFPSAGLGDVLEVGLHHDVRRHLRFVEQLDGRFLGLADQLHEEFVSVCNQQMDDHAAVLEARAELDAAMETFGQAYAELDGLLARFKASLDEGTDSWQRKDAAMEARIALGKAKSIGEEYSQLGLKDDQRKALVEEFNTHLKDFDAEGGELPTEAKDLLTKFRGAASGSQGVFASADHAAALRKAVGERLQATDAAGTQVADVLGDTEGGLENLVGADMDDAMAEADEASAAGIRNVILFLIGGLVVGLVAAWYTARSVTVPLQKAVDFAETVAKGDLTKRVDIRQNDETGDLGKALNGMADSLADVVGKITNGATTLAGSSTELSATATQLASGAEETTHQSGTVASAAEEMATNMSNMAAATEQMTANVKTVASATEQMIELKREINALRRQGGQEKEYHGAAHALETSSQPDRVED